MLRKVAAAVALSVAGASIAGCDPGTTIGPERPIGPVVTVPRTEVGGPQIAWNGTQRLAVWQTEREFEGTVEAAFVSSNGSAGPGFELFPFEVPAPYDAYGVNDLSVATLGTDFLVAFGFHLVGRGGLDVIGVSTVLVRADGTTRPGYQLSVEGDECTPVDPSLAGNGSSYLLAYADCDHRVRVTRLDELGSAVGAESQPVSQDGVVAAEPTVAASGTTFLVSWTSQGPTNRDILGRRVSGSGVVEAGPFVISGASGDQADPDSTGSASGFFVSWTDRRTGNQDVRATRISATGAVHDTAGLVVAGGLGNQREAATAYRSGSGYDVVWTAGSAGGTDIRGRLVSGAGVLGAVKLLNSDPGDQSAPDAAATSVGFVVAWEEPGPPAVVHGTRADAAGGALDAGLTWSTKPADQSCSSLAAGADGHLVTWQEVRRGQADIFGQRLGSDGAPQGSPFVITSAVGDQRCPAVAFGGGSYLVAWEDLAGPDKDIRGTLVGPSGAGSQFAIDAGPGEASAPAVAFDGNGFLVVWQTDGDVYGARLTPAGLGYPPFPVSAESGLQGDPAVAGGPHGFLVAWSDRRAGGEPVPYATPVSSEGVVEAEAGIELPGTINTNGYFGSFSRGSLTAAAGSDVFLVAWDEPGDSRGVRAARLAPDGTVLDPDSFVLGGAGPGPLAPRHLSAVWNGTDFVMVYRDRNCLLGCFEWHAYLVRVSPSGEADPGLDLRTLEVSGRFGVASASGRTVLSYDATRAPHHASTRVFVRDVH